MTTFIFFVFILGVLTGMVLLTIIAWRLYINDKKKKEEKMMQDRTFYYDNLTKAEEPSKEGN